MGTINSLCSERSVTAQNPTPEQKLDEANSKPNKRLKLMANVALWVVAMPLTVLYVCSDGAGPFDGPTRNIGTRPRPEPSAPSIALADMTEAQQAAEAARAEAIHKARELATQEEEAKRPSTPVETRPVGTRYRAGMTDADVNRLTSYAVFIGRATACGVDTGAAVEAVGTWIEAKMPPGSADRATLFPIFAQGMQDSARMQSQGRSPDTCDQVLTQFARISWP